MGPYRTDTFPSWLEEDLWLRLDVALEMALRSPSFAYSIAWDVWIDSRGIKDLADVRRASSNLMSELVDVFVESE